MAAGTEGKGSSHSMPVEDDRAIAAALAYVMALHQEMSLESGAPTLGSQNQLVDFILADPALREAVTRWAAEAATGEASVAPPRPLPRDETYHRIRARMKEHLAIAGNEG